ncbi:hypothetical protein JTB14_007105 [Gonioctena quinquepunctata]|nr:hypothetical protein JTB14_007105 [Gonioctena quinquepunctata]
MMMNLLECLAMDPMVLLKRPQVILVDHLKVDKQMMIILVNHPQVVLVNHLEVHSEIMIIPVNQSHVVLVNNPQLEKHQLQTQA